MLAAVYKEFHGPITVETVNVPVVEDDGVIVEVCATGVCRSDWHGWCGHDGDIKDHGLPFVPGHELSGKVLEVGPNVTKFKVGDAVAVPFILSCGKCRECARNRATVCEAQQQPGFTRWGSFAQRVSIPRADRNLTILPEGVSFAAAAAMGCRFTTAYRAVAQQGRLEPGQSLAVFGAGGVGLSSIIIGASLLAQSTGDPESTKNPPMIIAIDVSADALAKAKALGATHTVLVSPNEGKKRKDCDDGAGVDPAEAVAARVRELTGGIGADVSVDAAGFTLTCRASVFAARRGGRVVQVGLPLGEHAEPRIPMARVAGWELELLGSHGIAADAFPPLLDLIAAGKLDPEALIERRVCLSEGAKALMAMDDGSSPGITLITDLSK